MTSATKILVISDIHANLRALQAILDSHSDANEVWCLGDIDGDYRAQCVVIDNGEIRFERIDYDLEALRLDYSRSSLPEKIKKDWFRYTVQGIVDPHGLQLGPFSAR